MSSLFRRREAAGLGLLAFQAAAQPVHDLFPAHPVELAQDVVRFSHFDLERVKKLVGTRPALARAAVEWGFGDWEDALGAASHVGNRQIAEYLIANGARPTIFSAAMLGQLEVVKAFVAAQPGIQRIPGPHSISLLTHAKAGGKAAEPVFEYLSALGDAGPPAPVPLGKTDAAALAGTYVFGSRENDRIDITEKNGVLIFARRGASPRNLVHMGERAFHPVGAREARARFSGEGDGLTLTVHDPDLILTARRATN